MKRIITTTALMAWVVASAFVALGPATAHAATHDTAGIRIPLVTGTVPTVTNCDGPGAVSGRPCEEEKH